MKKQNLVRLILTVCLSMTGFILYILPEPLDSYSLMLSPALLTAVFAGLFCGWFSGVFTGAVIPLLLWILLKEQPMFPDILIMIIEASGAGLAAGLYYRIFRLPVFSVLMGVLISRILLPVSRILTGLVLEQSYTLADFFNEAVLKVWPGLLVMLILIPVFAAVFRKTAGIRLLLGREEE